MKKAALILSLLLGSLMSSVHADNGAINNVFKNLGIPVQEIQPSPIKGVSMVLTRDGVFYISDDGKYLMQTAMYDVSGATPVNVTLSTLTQRVEALVDEMIIYKAPKEEHVITVFTDPTCGYCVKLQNSIGEYNKEGITVRYLAYPRQGINSKEAKELQSVWCAKNNNDAFSKASQGEKVSDATCNIDITQHFILGRQLGVQGTPAIVYKDMLIPGYVEPKQLKAMLDSAK